MSEHTAENLSAYSQAYWKLCTILLGVALLVSLAIHAGGGPSSASASASAQNPRASVANVLAFQQTQAKQTLEIGGFDTVAGVPAFVLINEEGQRVGLLPMPAAAGAQNEPE